MPGRTTPGFLAFVAWTAPLARLKLGSAKFHHSGQEWPSTPNIHESCILTAKPGDECGDVGPEYVRDPDREDAPHRHADHGVQLPHFIRADAGVPRSQIQLS